MAFNISYIYLAKDRFTAVSKRVEKAARRVQARMRLVRRSTKSAGDAFDNMGAKFAKFVALTASLALFALPIKQAIAFEAALSDLNKVMEFRLPDGLERTGEALQKMAGRIPITTKGLVEIAVAGGQLGIVQKDILGFTESVGKISIALDLLPGETARSFARLSNIFQIPITEMESFADVINVLTNTTVAKADEIFTALANKGAAAGQAMGLTAFETLGLSSAFIETGVNAGRVGSIMDAMARRLTNVNVLGKRFVEDFVKNPRKELIFLLRQLNKLKGAEKTQKFNDIFAEFGIRVQTLAETMDTILIPTLKKAADTQAAAGSIQEEFNIRLATTKSQLVLMGSSFTTLGESIGGGFLPTVNAAAAVLKFIAEIITVVVKNTGPLVPMLLAAGAAFALVALGTLAWKIAQLGLNAALFANPIGLIVAGIAALAVGIIFLIDKFGGFEVVAKRMANVISLLILTPLLLVAQALDAITGSDFASKIQSFQASIKFEVPDTPAPPAPPVPVDPTPISDATIAGATNKTETEVNVNLNAPPGVIKSVESRTKGEGRTNVGQNLVMAGAG